MVKDATEPWLMFLYNPFINPLVPDLRHQQEGPLSLPPIATRRSNGECTIVYRQLPMELVDLAALGKLYR